MILLCHHSSINFFQLNSEYLIVDLPSGVQLKTKIRVFCTIFDSIARASIWSVNQFNGKNCYFLLETSFIFLSKVSHLGKFGCTKCKNPGMPGRLVGAGQQQIYLPCEEDTLAKDKAFYEDAYEICQNLRFAGNNEPYFGVQVETFHSTNSLIKKFKVKKKSCLASICDISEVDIIDIFHVVYEGVANFISRRIFLVNQPQKKKSTLCYVGHKIDEIQKLAMKIEVR